MEKHLSDHIGCTRRSPPEDQAITSSVTPTFALLEKKALPEFLKVFGRWLKLGKYTGSPVRKFEFSKEGSIRTFGHYDPEKPTIIFFGYAQDPESLESATAKAVWADEAGQKKFKLASWESLLRRLSLAQGRMLLTTTPYDVGWLKQVIYDAWKRGKNPATARPGDETSTSSGFDSTEKPKTFPQGRVRACSQLASRLEVQPVLSRDLHASCGPHLWTASWMSCFLPGTSASGSPFRMTGPVS